MSSEIFALYGTHEAEERPVSLSAGRLSADLANGNLRTIRYNGIEVLRAVSYLVRDRDWGTYSPRIQNLVVDQGRDTFSVRYTAGCAGPEDSALAIFVHIAATENELTFDAEALSPTGFETNRCGFCILHPIVGVAGAPATVEYVDGRAVDTVFPDLIDPWQPFKDMRAISHTVADGITARCLMEGDTFEMEDQRNWSDASYKTYVRPLALPWPYRIEAGETMRQRIVLTINDRRPRNHPIARSLKPQIAEITKGERSGTMPPIGVIVTPAEARATLASMEILNEVAPQHILFHFDPAAGHGVSALRDFTALAKIHSGSTTIEIALPCAKSPAQEAREIAAQMESVGFVPNAIVVSPSVDRQSTPPGSKWPECPPLEEIYDGARAAFGDVRLGGGMLSFFTELNRKPVPAEHLDFVAHCTNPIVHAADDLSVMQTLEALPFITRSVRSTYGHKPYRIGPSTIPMRQNPYGSRTMDNPDGKRLPMASFDPRHNGRFAEAFAFAYARQVADANLECLTLSAVTGPFGLIAGPREPSSPGSPRPIVNTIKTLSSLAGCQWLECRSSAPANVLALLTVGPTRRQLHLINIAPTPQLVDTSALIADQSSPQTLPPFSVVSIGV
ncbi:hypothetical protein [Rhizobium sp. Root1220]|uniref:D-apionate lactonase n=1 Tax=Rhizobium sp. Root1220 TaxID=1736432 RepID=UPI0006FB01DF|nr:hypothetical protein [Rhizobium sp. Root1220]KQV84406.1 hypothetical protein ASC90_02510 [Rhizobium sp. Root1220]